MWFEGEKYFGKVLSPKFNKPSWNGSLSNQPMLLCVKLHNNFNYPEIVDDSRQSYGALWPTILNNGFSPTCDIKKFENITKKYLNNSEWTWLIGHGGSHII